MRKFIFVVGVLFLMTFVVSADFGYNDVDGPILTPEDNTTSTINDTTYFQGYTPLTLRNWMENYFDGIYCKLTGCTMTGDLTVNANITADYYFGDATYLTNVPGGNASWNQTLADSLYAPIGTIGGNSSWNQTLADSLYAQINEPLWSGNYTAFNSTWSSTYNSTYDAYNSTGLIINWTDVIGSGADGTNGTDGTNGSDGYTPIYGVDYINGTDGTDGINGTNGTDGINGTNGTDGVNGTNLFTSLNQTQFDNSTGVFNIRESWLSTLFDLFFGTKDTDDLSEGVVNLYDNSSWNESWADTLYAILGYGDDWNKTYADTLYADIGVTGDNSSWNETYATSIFILSTSEGNLNVNSSDYWDNLGTINATQMEDSGGTLSILESWLTTFIDAWLGTKDTDDLTEGSTNLYDNNSWNETWADTKYALIGAGGNSSWNETYASTLYYSISNPSTFWNDTYATFNKTYADTLYADISLTDTNASTACATDEVLLGNGTCLSSSSFGGGASGIWTNVSGTATYEDDVNITGTITIGTFNTTDNGTTIIFDN